MGRFKYNIGDLVVIMDGSDCPGYAGNWAPQMERCIGVVCKIESAGTAINGAVGYRVCSLDESTSLVLSKYGKEGGMSWLFDERCLKPYTTEQDFIAASDEELGAFLGL